MAKKVIMNFSEEQLNEMALSKFSEDDILRALQRKLSNFGVTLMWNVANKHLVISGTKKQIENLLAFIPEADGVAQIIITDE